MGINIKNVIGLIGLVLLLFNGRVILNYARNMNPLLLCVQLQATSEAYRLLVLGILIVAVLLALRYVRSK